MTLSDVVIPQKVIGMAGGIATYLTYDSHIQCIKWTITSTKIITTKTPMTNPIFPSFLMFGLLNT